MEIMKKHWLKMVLTILFIISYVFLVQIKDVHYIEWNVRDGRVKNLHYSTGELLDVTAMYKEAVSNPEGYEIKVEMIGEVDINTLGEYPVVYKAEENGVLSEIHVTYVVKDVRRPVITLVGEETIVLNEGEEFIEPGYSAYDIYDGDVTEHVTTEITSQDEKGFVIKYSVTDSNGNCREIERTVIFEEE